MIREFFAPRTFAAFLIAWALIAAVLYRWFEAKPDDRHLWLTKARIPALSAGIAILITAALVLFVVFLN